LKSRKTDAEANIKRLSNATTNRRDHLARAPPSRLRGDC
jgi:hypothetical protein